METWITGAGLRPVGKPPDKPPDPNIVARHRSIPTFSLHRAAKRSPRGRAGVVARQLNGAGIIHDFELALVGGTSESVARWIRLGQFGLWNETGRLNEIIRHAAERGDGMGETVGRVVQEERFARQELSIAAAGWRRQARAVKRYRSKAPG